MGRLCFSTYAENMKECDAPESNSTTTEVALTKKHTKDNIWSFLGFLHSNMIDSPSSIVLLGGNRNRVGSTGRGRCRCSWMISMSARVGASVGIMSLLSIVEAPSISGWQILGSLGPMNILTSSSRGLEIIGALYHLMLQGRTSLTSWLRSLLKL
jgi:hypothetical protein